MLLFVSQAGEGLLCLAGWWRGQLIFCRYTGGVFPEEKIKSTIITTEPEGVSICYLI